MDGHLALNKDKDHEMARFIYDGKTYELDGDTSLVDRLLKENKALHEDKAAASKEIAELERERDKLKGLVLTEDQIEERAKERAKIIADAKFLYPEVDTGGALNDIRRAALKKVVPDIKLDGRDETYLKHRFDDIVEDYRKSRQENERLAQAVPKSTATRETTGGGESSFNLDELNRKSAERYTKSA